MGKTGQDSKEVDDTTSVVGGKKNQSIIGWLIWYVGKVCGQLAGRTFVFLDKAEMKNSF